MFSNPNSNSSIYDLKTKTTRHSVDNRGSNISSWYHPKTNT